MSEPTQEMPPIQECGTITLGSGCGGVFPCKEISGLCGKCTIIEIKEKANDPVGRAVTCVSTIF